ncbi:hypothetical protein [Paraflavitalea sp. CAU 1676]|uniref:hypothetical protein n=1 Tax=Paraflavitalea sp. CAU 1676 TaxID=3032598 RepID=UPI0023DB12B8|nr:hypothetical protein [Paraflavitalea sp. CAU 1676]MDF2187746.1 hypothetical protein [Paraflavitalea sp. CAU 1676]
MKTLGYILTSLCILCACGKDKQSKTFKGVVLRQYDRMPVAAAKIQLHFVRRGQGPLSESLIYTATTDQNGEYSIDVPDWGTDRFYWPLVSKPRMVQTGVYGRNWYVYEHRYDTLMLDVASYVKIDLTLNTFPEKGNGTKDTIDVRLDYITRTGQTFGNLGVEKSFKPPFAAEIFIDSFSYSESNKAYLRLYSHVYYPSKVLLEKEIMLDSGKTTTVKIEY